MNSDTKISTRERILLNFSRHLKTQSIYWVYVIDEEEGSIVFYFIFFFFETRSKITHACSEHAVVA